MNTGLCVMLCMAAMVPREGLTGGPPASKQNVDQVQADVRIERQLAELKQLAELVKNQVTVKDEDQRNRRALEIAERIMAVAAGIERRASRGAEVTRGSLELEFAKRELSKLDQVYQQLTDRIQSIKVERQRLQVKLKESDQMVELLQKSSDEYRKKIEQQQEKVRELTKEYVHRGAIEAGQ